MNVFSKMNRDKFKKKKNEMKPWKYRIIRCVGITLLLRKTFM